MTRVYEHKEPDRVPITDWVWESTTARWRTEGMPENVSPEERFGWDSIVTIGADVTPRFEPRVIEETKTYCVERDALGQTHKNFKPVSATPQYIDSGVKDRDTWREAKRRMTPARDRVNWQHLKANYKRWRREGAWIRALALWGFDVVSTRMCNSEIILYAMAEDPEWVKDMCDTGCDLALALFDAVWREGYTFDELFWCDDMAYRNGLLFSKRMWREIVMPYQKRYIDWAHAHGIKVQLHCCGKVNDLIPDLIDLGLDALHPLEVKAGVDPIAVKKQYGDRLALQGGFDIRNWSDPAESDAEIRRALPVLMESGGYVFSSDHSIADNVGLKDYERIVALVKEIGRYSYRKSEKPGARRESQRT